MESYITVSGESVGEYSEKRSRFIATLRHTETEEQAAAFLAEMRSKYWDARHNCYAYSMSGGTLKRFSDDGEPHGTAGKPILDIIDGSGLTDIMIVVTRYFGGVLLGTGGLVRAYSAAAREAVANANRVKMTPCTVYKASCGYSELERLTKLIGDCGGSLENTVYTENVELEFYLENSCCEDFLLKLKETFAARITAEEITQKMLGVAV
ncbi:MAG: YigZ family protein [Acutalibacteraceae bacterium]|nr:YigZ family protein [Acutalibacteraceae bacterium]